MTRLKTLIVFAITFAVAILPRAAWAAEKPNVLFIFADDQTYESINALGFDEVQTPNLDRLVRTGTTFTHAYNPGGWGGAICVASRTMLVTGSALWNAHRIVPELPELAQRGTLWPQLLEAAGYDTYMSGKWHVGGQSLHPTHIFNHVRNVRGGMPNQTDAGYNRPIEGEADPWKPWDPSYGGFWQGGTHWSEVLGNDAVDFLAQAGQRDAPFFMYLAFNAPHDPRQSPKEFVDRYPLNGIAVPDDFVPQYPHAEAIGCGPGLRDEKLAPFPRTEYAVKVNRQEYYAIITHLDDQVGRMLDALDATGKVDNTYVIFTADHGLSVGHHGLMGKQNMFDHSVRVPLIVCGPDIEQDKRIATPVYLQDVMPTTLEWADAEIPDSIAFRSLVPLLNGKSETHYDAIYGAYIDRQRMVTDGAFKLIYYPTIDKKLLFNLENDPGETNNVADSPEYASKVATLWAQLKSLQKDMGDNLELGD